MHEINVYIVNGQISVPNDDPIAVHSGDLVVWRIHNCDSNIVKWAHVEFKGAPGAAPRFFKERRGAGAAMPVPPPFNSERGTEVDTGHGCIMGTAPSIGGGGSRPFDYTVRGCDKDPRAGGVDVVPLLDPQIIIEDP